MTTDAPYWLQFVQPFGTIFLGAGAFVIAFRQWMTAHEKLRVDLFDKRARILDVVAQLSLYLIRDEVDRFNLPEMNAAMSGYNYLFGEKMAGLLSDFRLLAFQLQTTRHRLRRIKEESNFEVAAEAEEYKEFNRHLRFKGEFEQLHRSIMDEANRYMRISAAAPRWNVFR